MFFSVQDVIDRLQDRMSYGYQGSFFAPSCCQSMVSCQIIRIFSSCRYPCHFCDNCLYLLVSVGDASVFLPELSLLPGETPAQEARCFSVGKALISNPISATKSSEDFVLRPGTSFNNSKITNLHSLRCLILNHGRFINLLRSA